MWWGNRVEIIWDDINLWIEESMILWYHVMICYDTILKNPQKKKHLWVWLKKNHSKPFRPCFRPGGRIPLWCRESRHSNGFDHPVSDVQHWSWSRLMGLEISPSLSCAVHENPEGFLSSLHFSVAKPVVRATKGLRISSDREEIRSTHIKFMIRDCAVMVYKFQDIIEHVQRNFGMM